jgi:heme-degrading monooxygenase HmoA
VILREWRGRAASSNASAYPRHFHTRVLPELNNLAGFLGATLSQRNLDNLIEFVVLTRWESIEAIHAFAGSDVSRAVVEPEAVAALVDYDDRVQHYDVIEIS